MADTKISGMSAAAALTGSEVLPVVQSSSNVKATTQQVVDAAMTTGLSRRALGSINSNTTVDWSIGSYVTATITGSLTFTFSNPAPAGKACVAYLELTNGGSAVITWPVSVTWAGATAPTLRASGVDLLRFYTHDGGSSWFGELASDEQSFDASAITTGTIAAARLPAGTTSAAGALELATVAEAETGTDTARAVTPEGLTAAITARMSYAVFLPNQNQPPASSFATLDTRNSVLVLDFDDASVESACFVGVLPSSAYLTDGLVVSIRWMATSATTGNVRWRAEFEADGTDLDSDSFATATEATGAANGTSGIETTTEITCTTIDSLAAGDRYRLKVSRIGNDGTNDTMSGDAELVAVELRAA